MLVELSRLLWPSSWSWSALFLADTELAKVVLAHHVEVPSLSQHRRVVISASYLLHENVEAAALWGRIEAHASSTTCRTVKLKAKLAAGVATPDVDLGVEDFSLIPRSLLSADVLQRRTLVRGPLARQGGLRLMIPQLSLLLGQNLVVDVALVL